VSVVETVGLHWYSIFGQFVNLLFPPRCVGCRQAGSWLCAECMSQVIWVEFPVCARCGGRPVADGLCDRCHTSPLRIETIRSVGYFEGVLREAIHRLKYGGRTVLAEPLGDLMATYWMEHSVPVDLVVPVPLHAARLRERGYNQAALLAREVARRVGLVVDERVLIRWRATAPQVELDAGQRKENVRAAFRCASDKVAHKRILLIDDVCTTGATLEACAVALYERGAHTVQALTLARAR
jgi:ComF family protein